MKNSQKRAMQDLEETRNQYYVELCRGNTSNSFIRQRKLPLQDVLQSIINRKGLTLTLELRNYMKIAHPGEKISKPGYLKQRMKLNPEAFTHLYRFHNKNFYADGGYKTYNGYLVLAADGSTVLLPTTKETLEVYGTSSRENTKPQAALGLGCLYDVLNRMILESDCQRCKFDEMTVAEAQLDRVRDTIGAEQPYLVVMDRGYPSAPAFIRMMDKGIFFLARLKSSDFKREQAAMHSNDEWIEIVLDKTRTRHYLGTEIGNRMLELGSIRLRMVKVELDRGKEEVLLTNLPNNHFETSQFAELYHLRWGIETAFETLKSRLQLENFTGTKIPLILQDIFSTIYVSNLAQDIILEAEAELDEKDSSYKHKMAVNQTISIGILKNDLIFIIMESDPDKKNALFQNLYDEISSNLVPVRPDRLYSRTNGKLAARFSNTHKRAF